MKSDADWLRAKCPFEITHHRSGRDERKRRLLAAACARRVLRFAPDPAYTTLLDAVEAYADGAVAWAAVQAAKRAARKVAGQPHGDAAFTQAAKAAAAVLRAAEKAFGGYNMAIEDARHTHAATHRGSSAKWEKASEAERAMQVALARDVFPNPFRPVAFDPAWRTDTVVSLARGMYESRDFAPMPILADALQDAGCEHADVLNHARDPNGVHVRGCWVVDLVLGKG